VNSNANFNAAARKRNSNLIFFNLRKRLFGHAEEIIALKRRITTIIWHEITNVKYKNTRQGVKRKKFK